MATITGYTAERMQEIEDTTIVDGNIVGGHLILLQRNGAEIDAGSVAGPTGDTGPSGFTSIVLCTSSTRPTGGARFAGLYIYETDTKLTYVWDGAAWVYRGGLFICTSSTRPSSAIAGLPIYETDTQKLLVHNGFRFDPPWNIPWGRIGSATVNADQSAISTLIDVAGLTVPWTAVANRRYKVSIKCAMTASVAGNHMILLITDGANVVKDTFGMPAAIADGSGHCISGSYEETIVTAGSTTRKARAQAGAGTVKCKLGTQPGWLIVEDVGPNGTPA